MFSDELCWRLDTHDVHEQDLALVQAQDTPGIKHGWKIPKRNGSLNLNIIYQCGISMGIVTVILIIIIKIITYYHLVLCTYKTNETHRPFSSIMYECNQRSDRTPGMSIPFLSFLMFSDARSDSAFGTPYLGVSGNCGFPQIFQFLTGKTSIRWKQMAPLCQRRALHRCWRPNERPLIPPAAASDICRLVDVVDVVNGSVGMDSWKLVETWNSHWDDRVREVVQVTQTLHSRILEF